MSQESAKDLVIKRLKTQLEKYKNKLETMSFDNLSSKISELESELKEKENLINDLKQTAQMGGSGGDAQQIKTKMIVLQSKVRKLETELANLRSENENLKRQIKRTSNSPVNNQQVDLLKRQLRQEMETSDRLRQQINKMTQDAGSNQELQKKIKQLQKQLENARQNRSAASGSSNAADSLQIKNEMRKLNAENQELKKQLEEIASGGGGGPMATIRLQRDIANLKSQLEMMKKDKIQMQKKYEDLVRKQEFNIDDGW